MIHPVGDVLAAHAFMTRLPVPRAATGPVDPARIAPWLPLVGLTVGMVAAGARIAADPLGPLVAAIAACAAAPLVTGGFHEDGLADAFDGLGPLDRARRLEVMRDPRLGTFGALALVFSVLARVALLAPLGWRHAAVALVTGHVVGRWSTLPLARWAPAARTDGLGAAMRLGTPAVAAGTVVAVALVAPGLWWWGPSAVAAVPAAAGVVTALCGWWWTRAFGGVGGDTYGATNQLVEIAALAALVVTL